MHGDVWGPLGSIIAAACCLGVAPAIGAVSALGLGFLIDDLILLPLLVLFLVVTVGTLRRDRLRHGRAGPEALAWGATVLTVGGLWVSAAVVGVGLAALVGSSAWNWVLVRGLRREPAAAREV